MTTQVHKQPPFSLAAALRARHVALPAEHGAWVFLFSPLIIGLALGGVHTASLLLYAAVMAGFLIRQPVTVAVKVFSGRRPRTELPHVAVWLAIYGLAGLIAAGALIAIGYGFLLYLVVPALPVFAWHLWLVSRRAERRQALIEIVAGGVLALAAPAAYWVGQGSYEPFGWLLWALAWLQMAGTVLYAYLRLEQRRLSEFPTLPESLRMARPTLVYNLAALLVVIVLAVTSLVPGWLILAYLIQPLEVVYGILRPAVKVKPNSIGFRQLAVSTLFTVVFIAAWLI